eukprot:508904_1
MRQFQPKNQKVNDNISPYKRILCTWRGKKARISGGVKKAHRYRPGIIALREIRKYQKTGDLLIHTKKFKRSVDCICARLNVNPNIQFESDALEVLQEATESYITDIFTKSTLLTVHRKGKTILPKDIKLVSKLRTTKFAIKFGKKRQKNKWQLMKNDNDDLDSPLPLIDSDSPLPKIDSDDDDSDSPLPWSDHVKYLLQIVQKKEVEIEEYKRKYFELLNKKI